jgi:hypothetical protein
MVSLDVFIDITLALDISWGKGGRCVGLTTLPHHVPIVLKSGSLNLLEPSGPVMGLLYIQSILTGCHWCDHHLTCTILLFIMGISFDLHPLLQECSWGIKQGLGIVTCNTEDLVVSDWSYLCVS